MPCALEKLVCGAGACQPGANRPLAAALHNIGGRIDSLWSELLDLRNMPLDRRLIYGPLLGRSLLEVAATGLIARLDPIRVLLLHRAQAQPNYDDTKRQKISIQWSGDILSDSKKELDGQYITSWPYEKGPDDFSRAVLGRALAAICWHDAFQIYQDSIPDGSDGWHGELKAWGLSRFHGDLMGKATRCYSQLSKGVHNEFIMAAAGRIDEVTLRAAVREVLFVCATLGAVSHAVEHASHRIQLAEAIAGFIEVERVIGESL